MITIYNTTGKILFSITASEEVTETVKNSELINGNLYIEGAYEPSIYYIENNLPVLIPEKPASGIYNFNYELKIWERNIASEIFSINNIRINLLQESDWTDTVSAVERLGQSKYQEWQTYRQALRDIPEQTGFPLNVIWPVVPT